MSVEIISRPNLYGRYVAGPGLELTTPGLQIHCADYVYMLIIHDMVQTLSYVCNEYWYSQENCTPYSLI